MGLKFVVLMINESEINNCAGVYNKQSHIAG